MVYFELDKLVRYNLDGPQQKLKRLDHGILDDDFLNHIILMQDAGWTGRDGVPEPLIEVVNSTGRNDENGVGYCTMELECGGEILLKRMWEYSPDSEVFSMIRPIEG